MFCALTYQRIGKPFAGIQVERDETVRRPIDLAVQLTKRMSLGFQRWTGLSIATRLALNRELAAQDQQWSQPALYETFTSTAEPVQQMLEQSRPLRCVLWQMRSARQVSASS